MGRPPSNGGPSFRFNQSEIGEMESILQAHKTAMPAREVLVSLAEKFSNSEERSGKIEVQMKQVWNWFQNRRYAIRAKAAKSPGKLNITQMPRDDSGMVKGVPQATQPHAASPATVRTLSQTPQHPTGPSAGVRTFPQAPQHSAAFSVQSAGRVADSSQMEYEAKSARDGAWYDVSTFLSHRSLETGDPEVLVRFAGFGAEEDEWVNVRKNVRQRSLPCESSECVAVLPADLILCFQEGKEQALYFDAHVLDAQRRRHDVRGCRCRFLVRYDHDQSEEIVALRKICRRPETDYRLQQLHAVNESLSADQNNNVHTVSTLRVYPPAEVQPKQHKVEPVVPPSSAEVPQKRQRLDSAVSAPLPDGSQRQLKVEPVALAPPGSVPQNQHREQPAVPALSPEVPQYQHNVQPVPPAPSAQPLPELQKVEPMVPCPSSQASLEPQKVEPLVPVSSVQDSVESQNVEATVPIHSDEVPFESHKVQPVMHDPSTEASIEPHKVETIMPSSCEVKQELQTVETTVVGPLAKASEEHYKAEPAPSGEVSPEPQAVGPAVPLSSAQESPLVVAPPAEIPAEPHTEVAESHKEPIVSGSSVEGPAVAPAVPLSSAQTSPLVVAPPAEMPEEVPAEPHKEEPDVGEPHKESMVSGSSVEGPAVAPAVPLSSAQTLPSVAAPPAEIPVEAPAEPQKEEPEVAEPHKEPMVSGSSVEEPAELREGHHNVHDQHHTSALEAIENKAEEPMVPVPTMDSEVIEAEIQQPKLSEITDTNEGNVNEDKHAKVADNASDDKVEISDLSSENAVVASHNKTGPLTGDMEEG